MVLTLREEPAAGLVVRTKRLPDVVPALLNMLRQPAPDMACSEGIMTASTGAVTPGSTSTIRLPWLSMVVGRSMLRRFLLGARCAEERRLCIVMVASNRSNGLWLSQARVRWTREMTHECMNGMRFTVVA